MDGSLLLYAFMHCDLYMSLDMHVPWIKTEMNVSQTYVHYGCTVHVRLTSVSSMMLAAQRQSWFGTLRSKGE